MVKEKNIETSDKFCEAEMVKIREQNYFSGNKKISGITCGETSGSKVKNYLKDCSFKKERKRNLDQLQNAGKYFF